MKLSYEGVAEELDNEVNTRTRLERALARGREDPL